MPPQKPVMNLPTSSMALFLASTNKSQPNMKGMDTEISVHFLPKNLNAAAESKFLLHWNSHRITGQLKLPYPLLLRMNYQQLGKPLADQGLSTWNP